VPVLVGFRNGRDTAVNVSFITGSINAPGFFPQYLQNLTVSQYGFEVPAGLEFTLPYTFQLSPQLGPTPYTLALSVFYNAGGEPFASTAFNATVQMAEEAGGWFDGQGAMMALLGVAGVGAAVHAASGGKGGGKAKAKGGAVKAKARTVETGTSAAVSADANEWLVGTSLHQPKKKAAPPPKKAAPAGKKGGKQ
jgi:hypothetical protein